MKVKRIEEMLKINTNFSCIDDNGIHTHNDIIKNINNLCACLQDLDTQPGERIIFLSDNSVVALEFLGASLKSNAVLIPISCRTPIKKLAGYINALHVRIIFISSDTLERLDLNYLTSIVHIITWDQNEWKVFYNDNIEQKNIRIIQEDGAFILFSSGTTKEPRAWLFSHQKVLGMLTAINEYMQSQMSDVFFISKQAHHVSTWIGEILMSIFSNASLSIRNSSLLLPRRCLENMESDSASVLFANPYILSQLINIPYQNEKLKSLRKIYVSGSPLNPVLHKKADEYFQPAQVLNIYGLTEAGPRVFAQRKQNHTAYGSVGNPVQGVSVFLKQMEKGDESYIKVIPPYEKGLLFVNSPYAPIEYRISQNKLMPLINDIYTGDIAYYDEQNNYYIEGRSDDIIFCNTLKVNPIIVESQLCGFDNVDSCVVFGITDAKGKERIIALYSTKTGVKLNIQELHTYLKDYLEPHECPSEIHWCSKSFISEQGKINRTEARRYYYEQINRKD